MGYFLIVNIIFDFFTGIVVALKVDLLNNVSLLKKLGLTTALLFILLGPGPLYSHHRRPASLLKLHDLVVKLLANRDQLFQLDLFVSLSLRVPLGCSRSFDSKTLELLAQYRVI